MSIREIVVVSADKRRFNVPISQMRQSNLFNSMLENAKFDEKSEFELSEISGDVFEKVLEWCRHHEGELFNFAFLTLFNF
jgi:hypothetical protein